MTRQRFLSLFMLISLMLISACWAPAHGQAFCSLTNVSVNALANGVQIQVKSDGILTWNWEKGSESAGWGAEMREITVRFPGARIGTDKTQYDVDQDPVSNITLMTPQDAQDGRGVVMRIVMSTPASVEAGLSEDRTTFLLTVKGKRTVERVKRGSENALKSGNVEVTEENGLISVRAVKANIQDVVAEVARRGNINVAIDDAVRHDISINISNKPPLEVIRGIASGYGLALSSVGDVYMLCEGVPADITTYQRSDTTSFSMRYLKAKDARSLLPNFLVKFVHDNPEQNAVVVTAPAQMLEKIGKTLSAIDTPPPMILVECAVVELTDSKDFDSQFRWQYQAPEFNIGTDSGTGVVNYQKITPQDGLASAILPTPQLQVWLQALTTKGRAEVQAHPSMAAVNGKYGEIFIGSQRFIKVTSSVNGQQQERLETVPVGVRLKITPWTGGNDEITTWVEVEVSNIAKIDPQSGVPLLGTRRASTTMRTRAGETIVIGGLTQRQDEKTHRRIPLLGDIPLIGSLFRSKATRASNTELVLLIRPRLLNENGTLPTEEDIKIRQEFLQPDDLGYPGPVEEKK